MIIFIKFFKKIFFNILVILKIFIIFEIINLLLKIF